MDEETIRAIVRDEMSSGKLTGEQKRELAVLTRQVAFDSVSAAGRRGAELADQFTSLEVQIAAILFALTGLFIESFLDGRALAGLTTLAALWVRIGFATSIFFLILSLIIGLLHIKRKEKFWDDSFSIFESLFKKWSSVLRKEATYEEGRAFHAGVAHGDSTIMNSPSWTWILQTIFLGLAIAILFVLGIVFLFK